MFCIAFFFKRTKGKKTVYQSVMKILTVTLRNFLCVGRYVMMVCLTCLIVLFSDCHEITWAKQTKLNIFLTFSSVVSTAYLNHFSRPTVKAYYISFVDGKIPEPLHRPAAEIRYYK